MGYRFSIRALVLHASRSSMDELEGLAGSMLEARDRIEEELDIRIGTVRITLPGASPRDVKEQKDVMISIGNLSSSDPGLEEKTSEAVRKGFLLGILLEEKTWRTATRISELIHKLSEESIEYPTRLGVNALGEPLYTPYYPLSFSPGDENTLSASLLYPNYLRDLYNSEGLEGLKRGVAEAGQLALRALSIASSVTGARVGGVDLSVSPWMEESSLGLVEAVAGTRLGKPGFALGLRIVNDVLDEIAQRLSGVGFNEVQLPVAEDSRLKARVSEGEVRARDLLRLTGVCLAGLDLAVVPASVSDVAGLLLDAAAYAKAKRRALGVRIVPVEGAEPGERVVFARFGETPVMAI